MFEDRRKGKSPKVGGWQVHKHCIKTKPIGDLAKIFKGGGWLAAHHALEHAVNYIPAKWKSKGFANHLKKCYSLLNATVTKNWGDLKSIGISRWASLLLTQSCRKESFTIRILPLRQLFEHLAILVTAGSL